VKEDEYNSNMMKKKGLIHFLAVLLSILFFCFSFLTPLQINIASEGESDLFWKFMGGTGQDLFVQSISENGFHYIIGNSNSTNLFNKVNTLKNGNVSPTYHGFLLCYGNYFNKLLYTVHIKGSNIDLVSQMMISKEYIYIIGATSSPDLPKATNSKIKEQSGFISKINKFDGSIVYSTYLGDQDFDRAIYVFDTDNGLFVFGQNDSSNIIVGIRPSRMDEAKTVYSFFISSINNIDGTILYHKRFAETEEEQNNLQIIEKTDSFLLSFNTDSIDFPLAKYRRELSKLEKSFEQYILAEVMKIFYTNY
jgi:hypothetical protein